MDAVKYFKEKAKMVKAGKDGTCCIFCKDCGLSYYKNGRKISCGRFEKTYPEEAVAIVEKWSEEHPLKTRAQVFFEKFPDAKTSPEDSISPSCCVKEIGFFDENEVCPGYCTYCTYCWSLPAPDKYQDWGDK